MKKFLTCLIAGSVLLSLGLFLIHCGGTSESGCSSNADCAATEFCDLTTKKCKPNTACDPVQKCAEANKCCGDDGCGTGGTCADNCGAGTTCDPTTCTCKACTPDCSGRVCGLDPVCGEVCGTCTGGTVCENGACVTCTPDCTGRVCGPDPVCQQSCGTCDAGYTCNAAGTCEVGGSQPGDPCPNGDGDCPAEFPTCLSGGGSTYCSKVCTGPTDTSCGAGNCCQDFGGGFFCWDPTQCPGESQAGDPCPFTGDVNGDADQCAAGLDCLGIAASADNGTCPGGQDSECTDVSESWNPSCVGGNCGASFCAEPCVNDACGAGFVPQTIDGLGCRCVPEGESDCSDPINDVGCEDGYKCIPYQGTTLACTEEGTQTDGQPCGTEDGWCVSGYMCLGPSGAGSCYKICDSDNQTGCPGDPGDYYCIGITGIEVYGGCIPTPECTLESFGAECADDQACIIDNQECSEFRCFLTNGKAENVACTYTNDCQNGLLCIGTPGVCSMVCITADDCSSSQTGPACINVEGCPTTWGVCGTEG
jgi:hypothetical protein